MVNKSFKVNKWTNKNLWYELCTCDNDMQTRKTLCIKYGCVFSHTSKNAFYVFPVNVYLDDERRPPRNWFIVDNIIDMKNILLHCDCVEMISLDHDLGIENETGTGYDILLFVEQLVYDGRMTNVPKILIHTANTSARPKMEQAVASIEKIVRTRKQ